MDIQDKRNYIIAQAMLINPEKINVISEIVNTASKKTLDIILAMLLISDTENEKGQKNNEI